ncbi:bifunctional proline dehydrogenase/L-glutamate gamma-semialdehyde dehydrogenase PutA [Telmatospirillum sp. J64-1]|uniref:bifunctional proline dehydrogenase/L-glutamate gamma-semialdehyde dehydrogenase PutA n=1 Tax=Telmatospirillum sp. J64-1 TaxID=2502183 RepID=UPI00115C8A48|nr:bifunctional proline dehydrogenase/L-glutamate gamma-semialdehyde dehydrogenase PutA [Telmatospirillum sp. J64-1]
MRIIRDPIGSQPLRHQMRQAALGNESQAVARLLQEVHLSPEARSRIETVARQLVEDVRLAVRKRGQPGIEAFLREYRLTSEEGVVLMCLAEALLRIPDSQTANRLIRDRLAAADWARHLGQSDSAFVNASTWALMLTGRMVATPEGEGWRDPLRRLLARSGEPMLRQAIMQAMRIMGRQFVMGRTIGEALSRARADEKRGYRHSFDMLGEGARTAADAERHMGAYAGAIAAIGRVAEGRGPVEGPGVSVKLSALHPRYEYAQRDRVLAELVPRLAQLAAMARGQDIGLTVDAEEADRLDLSLSVIEAVMMDDRLRGWDGFGVVVQAYQKRAIYVLDWLADLARRTNRRLMLRLVKGAYWDSEIKWAQERGLPGYPVFTRKAATDLSYLACVQRLFHERRAFYPMFATHNAHTVASVLQIAGARRDFEFQRLHGMGEALYDRVIGPEGWEVACRIYAPVGNHEELLPYLVRRLMENGANTSFVHSIADEKVPVDEVVADPVARVQGFRSKPHPRIPLPRDLYRPERRNSTGIDLPNPDTVAGFVGAMAEALGDWRAGSIIAGREDDARGQPVFDPSDRRRMVGHAASASFEDVDQALEVASRAAPSWEKMHAEQRADILARAADQMERAMPQLAAMCVREAGKTIPDAVAEVREAVDFCRYYGARARELFGPARAMPGPTGESNRLSLHGRGVFACISPWNFPLAIFTGQVTAALAAGNAVVAKPAEQTPLIAAEALRILLEAGVPPEVLHLLPGEGDTVGAALVRDRRVNGVAFTGSTEAAAAINRSLAGRGGAIVPLIAETGGQNAMIVDSSALPEQVVGDVVTSAFHSAGQRCSALRILCVQEEIADRILDMLAGAMEELSVGDPWHLSTEIGPVIDAPSLAVLEKHVRQLDRLGRLIGRAPLHAGETGHGTFIAPGAWYIDNVRVLEREVFGPILHVVRWHSSQLDNLLDDLSATGYGLTLGVHSRVNSTIDHICRRMRVGNIYVNRSMIGAVVGTQPFGGEGLSGTGPKAGGPHYLTRFACERSVTVNIAASGGNPALLGLEDAEDI